MVDVVDVGVVVEVVDVETPGLGEVDVDVVDDVVEDVEDDVGGHSSVRSSQQPQLSIRIYKSPP